ncbi:hypothetical protein DENSPDRAFT_870420, partial [Dentipellis sp. KUC8613]
MVYSQTRMCGQRRRLAAIKAGTLTMVNHPITSFEHQTNYNPKDTDMNQAQDSDDVKTKTVEGSHLVELLKIAGIPVYYQRKEINDKSNKWLSASTATKELLQEDYNWRFDVPRRGLQSEGTEDMAQAHTALFDELDRQELDVTLPEDWWMIIENADEELRELKDAQSPAVKLTAKAFTLSLAPFVAEYNNTQSQAPSQQTQFFAKESTSNTEHVSLHVGRIFSEEQFEDNFIAIQTILAAVTLDELHGITSELPVERHLGRLLAGIFSNKGCETLSVTPPYYIITFHIRTTRLACFGLRFNTGASHLYIV